MSSQNSPIRVAVVGAGVIGTVHADAIAALGPRATLALVVDIDGTRASSLADKHGADHSHLLSDAVDRPDIDAVAICTPSGLHADHAVAVLDAGKHVIIEKPIDVTLEAARRVADAEQRNDRIATVVSQHRFDTSSQVVHRAIAGGEFGRMTSGTASISWWRSQDYYDSGEWRGTWKLDGGGALMNQGIHTIDLLVWMLGEPLEVFAWTDCLAHERIEVEDTAVATIRFAGGALGVIHGTTAAYPGLTARLQVHGDQGSAVIDDDRLEYFHTARGASPSGQTADHQVPDPVAADSGTRTAGADPGALSSAHVDQYRDFLDAIETGGTPLVTVASATRALAVVRAIYESAGSGRAVSIQADQLTGTAPAEHP